MLRESLRRRVRQAGVHSECHRAHAEALTGATTPEQEAARAQHLFEAGRYAQAHGLLREAARRCFRHRDVVRGTRFVNLYERSLIALSVHRTEEAWGHLWLLKSFTIGHRRGAAQQRALIERALREALCHAWAGVRPLARVRLARLSYTQGETLTAVTLLDEAIEDYAAAGEALPVFDSRVLRAIIIYRSGEAQRGIDAMQSALIGFPEPVGEQEEARVATAIHEHADMLADQGFYDQAMRDHQRALDIFKRLDLLHPQSLCLSGLGAVARHRGQLFKAKGLYQHAIKIFEGLGEEALYHRLGLGMTELRLGNFEHAHQITLGVLQCAQRMNRRDCFGWAHALLLPSCAQAKDWTSWRYHIDAHSEAHRSAPLNNRVVAEPLELAGDIAASLEEADHAAEAYRLALEIWRRLRRDQDVARIKAALKKLYA